METPNRFLYFIALICLGFFTIWNGMAEEKIKITLLPIIIDNALTEAETATIQTAVENFILPLVKYDLINSSKLRIFLESKGIDLKKRMDLEYIGPVLLKDLLIKEIVILSIAKSQGQYNCILKWYNIQSKSEYNKKEINQQSLTDLLRDLENAISNSQVTELLIKTSTIGADIFINSENKGKSPLYVKCEPYVKMRIEGKKDNLVGIKEFIPLSGFSEVFIELKQKTGRIVIQTIQSKSILDVYLDDMVLGKTENGIFNKEVPEGQYKKLMLKGDGYSYIKENVTIESNKTLELIKPVLVELGSIVYALPEFFSLFIDGTNASYAVHGTGKIEDALAGKYSLRLRLGDKERICKEKIEIRRNFATDLSLTILPEIDLLKQQVQVYFENKLIQIKEGFSAGTDYVQTIRSIEAILIELAAYAPLYAEIREELGKLKGEMNQKITIVPNDGSSIFPVLKWISFTAGGCALAGSGVTLFFSRDAYGKYVNAGNSQDAINYRMATQNYNAGTVGLSITGVVLCGLGLIFAFLEPSKVHENPSLNLSALSGK